MINKNHANWMIDLHQSNWRELPFRGELRQLVILGNGKDSILRFIVPDGRAFAVELCNACTSVSPSEGIIVSTVAWDDTALEVRYMPKPGWKMQVAQVKVDYPGSDEDWDSDCRLWQQREHGPWSPPGRWAVTEVDVELVASADPHAEQEHLPADEAKAP